MLINSKSSPQWKRHSRKLLRRLIGKDLLWPVNLIMRLFLSLLNPFRARLFRSSRGSKKLSSRLFSTNWTWRRNKDNLRSNRTRNLRIRSPRPRGRDNRKKFSLILELLSLKNCKKKRLLKNWRQREWSKSSSQHRLFKKPRPLLPRKQLLRLTWLD